jgi:ribulose-phosphate 3-epimerase
MATKLVMPYMSAQMEQGVLVNWRKREGDDIAEGDIIADIESDRAAMALKSYIEGTLLQHLVSEGTSVAVGEPIAIIGEKGEALATASRRKKPRFDDRDGDTSPHSPIPMPKRADSLIAPSLLSCDFSRIGEEVKALEAAGADWLHIDVMDGRFVPNITIGLPIVQAIRRVATIPLDVHLMIADPDRYIDQFADAGAAVLTVHYEACTHLHRCLQMIRKNKIRSGVALNPHTPIELIEHVLDEVDMVLIMTVNPGFGGQSYISACTEKIRRLRAHCERTGKHIDIQVDGGIRKSNISVPASAGANIFVSGSGVFDEEDYAASIRAMRAQINTSRLAPP